MVLRHVQGNEDRDTARDPAGDRPQVAFVQGRNEQPPEPAVALQESQPRPREQGLFQVPASMGQKDGETLNIYSVGNEYYDRSWLVRAASVKEAEAKVRKVIVNTWGESEAKEADGVFETSEVFKRGDVVEERDV